MYPLSEATIKVTNLTKMKRSIKNIVLIAGGVGGAKLAEGLHSIKDINLAIIGNIADDDEFHGLRVSPDIDTLTLSLIHI